MSLRRDLRPSAVEKEKTVYQLVNFKNSRAQLKYHDPENFDAGKGKIVLDFLQGFLRNLAELGFTAHLRTRFVKPAPSPEVAIPSRKLCTDEEETNR